MIVFTNDGEIDIRSITTFGISVKETDNPIGFFGTGLKYAIAVLLRTGHQVAMLAGEQCINFFVREEAVRGKSFQFVVMSINGGEPQSMGFTTELGKQWKVWMAYREIACNCTDEGGKIFSAYSMPSPRTGTTQVIVTGEQFEKCYEERRMYILDDEPAMMLDDIEVRRRSGTGVFYRGVRVHEWSQPGLYTYNLRTGMTLTEDRTLKSEWNARAHIAMAILKSGDAPFIQSVIVAKDDRFEGCLDFHGWSLKPSEAFLDAVEACIKDKIGHINQTAMKVWKESDRARVEPNAVTLSKVQLAALNRAQNFCEGIGFPVRSYPLVVAESLGPSVLGLAQDGTIYIAARVFDQGVKQIASTLIEEYIHLKHGMKDCTRELQTFLFDRVVSMGEELRGEPL